MEISNKFEGIDLPPSFPDSDVVQLVSIASRVVISKVNSLGAIASRCTDEASGDHQFSVMLEALRTNKRAKELARSVSEGVHKLTFCTKDLSIPSLRHLDLRFYGKQYA